MDSAPRETTDYLISRLVEEPFGFNFFRAVRLLESHFRAAPRIGTSQRLKDNYINNVTLHYERACFKWCAQHRKFTFRQLFWCY